jgi:IS30 family transposase
MTQTALTLHDRDEISLALISNPEVSWAVIGRSLCRHPTTIMREVERNGSRNGYRPATADRRAAKRLHRQRDRELATPGPLRDRVIAELTVGRSPFAIWADLRVEELELVCVETIYSSLFDGTLGLKPTACLRTRRSRRRSRQSRHVNNRPALPNISIRSAVINERSEPGHWEADHIVGKNNRSALLHMTERVTNYSILITMPDGYGAPAALAGLVDGLERIPAHLRKSLTFDQGSEWALWQTLEDTYDLKAFFCDPHSPWQRGQVENINRQWRWWFPRGTDLSLIEPDYADHVASIINNQRCRSLNYKSPAILYNELIVQ